MRVLIHTTQKADDRYHLLHTRLRLDRLTRPAPDGIGKCLQNVWASYQANPSEGKAREEFEEVFEKLEGIKLIQTIAAHFDGKEIVLDEAVELEPNTELLVTVLPKDDDGEAWLNLSAKRLQDAYAPEEEDYSV